MIDTLLAFVDKHPRVFLNALAAKGLGYCWHRKRIYRVYLQPKLSMRLKLKRRLANRHRLPLAVPIASNLMLVAGLYE